MSTRGNATSALLLLALPLFAATPAFAQTVSESESFTADRVRSVSILDRQNAGGLFSRTDVTTTVRIGRARGRSIEFDLQGRIDSNRRFRGSRLGTSLAGGDLDIEVFISRNPAMLVSQRGELELDVRLPVDWKGGVAVSTSSGTVLVGDGQFSELTIDVSSGSIELGTVIADTLDVKSSSDRTVAEEIIATSVAVDTSSGGISVDRLVSAQAEIESSSGSVGIGSGSGPLSVAVSSGAIEIAEFAGPLSASSSSGSISVAFAEFADDAAIEASSGEVRVSLPQGSGARVDLEVTSGAINVDFPVQGTMSDNQLRGSVNGGGPLLSIQTTSGSIYLDEGR